MPHESPPDLTGTVALVAGATRGAGRAGAIKLGRAGATVVVTGRSTRTTRPDTYGAILTAAGLPELPGTVEAPASRSPPTAAPRWASVATTATPPMSPSSPTASPANSDASTCS
jgi:NAD(P)-dependent dehydrogenase (short-subunit alcohol dehydrogenase family)